MKIDYCQCLRSLDSRSDPAPELAVFQFTQFQRVETKLGDRLPPQWLGKHMQQHLCPLVLQHHAVLGDYSTDVVICAKERLQVPHIVSTQELGAGILEIIPHVDEVPGSTVGQPRHVQHLHPEYSPISFYVSMHHDNHVWSIRTFHTVVREHHNGIGAGAVGTGEGGGAVILVDECHHVRAKTDRHAWTKGKWHLIPVFGCS